ncbi:ArpU family phage packaging/lysis transcriptional regulator [Pediococcus pentosaceus]|uniref:ArpU family phage packaging/lysis transcriptional regulator n=1 Tax=Pediococcus pentosaceus TaxID=1255 RepID=UPI0013E8A64A|nr:ArpU family phage packaging/lysis transcriptional regulator [Pediococcus pentosaceus]
MAKFKEVIKILKQVPKWKRIAGKSLTDLHSPTIDNMPRSSVQADDRIINRINAKQQLERVKFCLSFLSDEKQKLLRLAYMSNEHPTNIKICMKMRINEGTFYRLKKAALQEFREAYYGY